MPSESKLTIRLDLIKQNARALKARTRGKFMAVLKADAYGLGAIPVARELKSLADFFCVATPSEAVALRTVIKDTPILVLGYVMKDDRAAMIASNIRTVISSYAEAAAWDETAAALGCVHKVHLSLDTGHHRLGVDITRFDAAVRETLRQIMTLPHLEVEAAYSHFSTADEANGTGEDRSTSFPNAFSMRQMRLFQEGIATIRAIAKETDQTMPFFHIANDGGLLSFAAEELFDGVRPGIGLYGHYPSEDLLEYVDTPLFAPYRWTTNIVSIREIPVGDTVGYGRTWTAQRPTVVATVQVGYADGYFRSLSNKGWMLIHGIPCPVIGRVCMDQTMIDITDVPHAELGDEVVVLGPNDWAEAYQVARMVRPDTGKDPKTGKLPGISAAVLGEAAGTIHYEVLTNIHQRVNRVYEGGSQDAADAQ